MRLIYILFVFLCALAAAGDTTLLSRLAVMPSEPGETYSVLSPPCATFELGTCYVEATSLETAAQMRYVLLSRETDVNRTVCTWQYIGAVPGVGATLAAVSLCRGE